VLAVLVATRVALHPPTLYAPALPAKANNDVDKGKQPVDMNSTYHSLYVPRSLRSPGPAPFRWACTLFAPLAGGALDLFLGFQYSRLVHAAA